MRQQSSQPLKYQSEFQFTHPGRGATALKNALSRTLIVSIHAPREGCDVTCTDMLTATLRFQFTHPGRGATQACTISNSEIVSFNSRTPGGVRLRKVFSAEKFRGFQFTHPGRGATSNKVTTNLRQMVSIHAPREGCDHHLSELADEPTVSIHAPREGCDS